MWMPVQIVMSVDYAHSVNECERRSGRQVPRRGPKGEARGVKTSRGSEIMAGENNPERPTRTVTRSELDARCSNCDKLTLSSTVMAHNGFCLDCFDEALVREFGPDLVQLATLEGFGEIGGRRIGNWNRLRGMRIWTIGNT